MRPNGWLKRIAVIVLLAQAIQLFGVPIVTAHALPGTTALALSVAPAAMDDLLAAISFDALPSPGVPAPAGLPSTPWFGSGESNARSAGMDACAVGQPVCESISYASRSLALTGTLGSAGPLLVLRYESRPQPVPMLLSAPVPTPATIQRWTIQIAGWTYAGEGSQPLALWDTTDKGTGDLVPAGVYDMEIAYESEAGVGSAMHPVIVQRPEAGALGGQWWHNYEVRLQVLDEERVLLEVFGYPQLFTGKQNKYVSTSAQGHTLTREPDGTWRWVRDGADGAPVQGVTTLDAAGRATRWEEPSGRYLAFAYDDAEQLTSITDQSGRNTTLAYEDGRISSVTDAAGSTWRLSYDGDDLVMLADPLEAEWSLAYDGAHRLTAKTDPLGYSTAYAYADDGQLSEIVDPAGHRVLFETVLNHQSHASAQVLTVAPILGTTLVSYVSAQGNVTSRHSNAHDAQGRVVRIERSPDGGDTQYVWERTWGLGENSGLVLAERSPDGLTTTFSYRAGTALVERVSAPPLPDVTYGYKRIAGYWAMTSLKIGDQATRYWRYDARGRCTGVEQGGLRWFYTYDGAATSYGQPSAMVWNWNGQGDPARSSGARILRYTYDDRGQLVGAEDPAGGQTRYGYDEAGRLVSVTDALERTRTIAYDPAGRVVRQADALGGQTVYTYDAAGRLTTVTDAAGSVTAYAHDHAGRLTGVTDPLGRRTGRVYDNEGYLLSRTDARGDTVTFSNDTLGRPLALSYPGGQAWRLTYEAAGNVTSMSGQGLARTVQRDVAGRVLQVADIRAGRTIWVAYAYNASGQIADMRTSDGGRTTYAYGSVGELVRISGPLGDTEYTYQTVGQLAPQRVAVRTGPLRTTLTYDALGQLTAIRQYQQASRLGADRTTRYTYDAVGNVVAMEAPEGTTAYSYDDLDRLTGWVDPAGIETTYAYDAVGNRTSLAVEGGETTNYLYDPAHQLLQAGDTRYTYDRNGRLVSAAGAGGLRTYSWDYDGRLVSVAERGPCALPYPLGPGATREEVVAAYRYAPTGERVQTVRADGVLETYRYDGSQAVAVLNEAGRVFEARQRGAERDEWTMVALSPSEAGGSPLVRYLLSDAYGSVVGAADEAGALVWQVAYDPWGVPQAAGNEGITEVLTLTGFQGHAFETETGLYDLDGRWYDPAVGRYLSPDPAGSACGPGPMNGYLFAQNNPLRFTRILSESHRPITAAGGLCARGGAQEGSLCHTCGATAGSTGVGAYGAIGQLFAQLPGVESGLTCPR